MAMIIAGIVVAYYGFGLAKKIVFYLIIGALLFYFLDREKPELTAGIKEKGKKKVGRENFRGHQKSYKRPDGVIYINLDHRKDRKKDVHRFLKKIGYKDVPVYRLSATLNKKMDI